MKTKHDISKEEAVKLNNGLARHIKKKTIETKENELVKQIKEKMADPNLLVDTIKEIGKEVEGEEDTILTEIIVASTRLVKNAIPESTNLLLSDKTGLGKDWVTKKTLEVTVPEDDLIHITKMTPESFTYYHYDEEGWTWDGKVIHFEDVTQALLNCSTFKTMSSGDNFAVVVKEQKTIEIPIIGKPCMILTSHHANPRDESLRRFRIGGLNETKKQTRGVMNKISIQYTGNNKIEQDTILRGAVQSLEPYTVIIPFAEILQHFFPDNDIMRTAYRCFLDWICGSAIFHQAQRKKTEKGELIATPDDYMIARVVLIYTTSNPKMIPMSKEYRDIIKILADSPEPLSVREIEVLCDFSLQWLYKHLPNITSTGIVTKEKREDKEANKPVTVYKFAEFHPNMIPTWGSLTDEIKNILYKTNKTNKTNRNLLLESWFSTHHIKPIKPKDGRFSMVLYGHNITLSREVLTVLTVFHAFLRERDEKRYQKYFKEPDPPLKDELQIIKNSIETNRKANFKITLDWLYENHKTAIIDQCIQSGLLTKLPNNEYDWRF